MVVLRRFTSGSTTDIGRWLNNMDHTSTIHGLRKLAPITAEVAQALPTGATVSQWVRILRAYTEGELAINGETKTIRDGSRTLPLLSYRRPERVDGLQRDCGPRHSIGTEL